jgi:hypothetical protein
MQRELHKAFQRPTIYHGAHLPVRGVRMKYYLQMCLALMAPLIVAACGTPEQPNTAAQPAPQQTVGLVATMVPLSELITVAPPMPTTAPFSEASSQAITAKPIPQPNTPAQSCIEPLSDGASPAVPNSMRPGQPSIATTACPYMPVEQTPSDQIVDPGSTVAPSGAGTGQIVVTGSTSAPNQSVTVPNNNTPTPLLGGRTIGLDDQQQTLELSVGETFELRLGSGMDWTIQIADTQIIARMPGDTTDDSQGVYQALAQGTTVLIATGDPPCRKAEPACMMPSIAFTLNIVVH